MRTKTWWLTALGVVGTIAGAAPAQAADVQVTAARASSALLADGRPSFGEWPVTGPSTEDVRVRLSSDDRQLHVLVDGLGVRSTDDAPASILVDVNRDGRVTAGIDQAFTVAPGATVQRVRFGGGDTAPEIVPTLSSAALRRDCFAADGTRTLDGAAIRCDAHHAAEFSLELAELGVEPGQFVHAVVVIGSAREAVRFPGSGPSDGFGEVLVVEIPPVVDVPDLPEPAEIEIPLLSGLEVLQSTKGSLQVPLVADKPTVVRVLPRVLDAADDRHPATVRLRGERNGQELPGSPLSQPLEVRSSPNRMTPGDGATFVLPESWTRQGTLTVTGQVTQAGPSSPKTLATIPFVPTSPTSVWTVPLQAGFGLPSATQMSQQESRADTILPVAGMYFPRRASRNALPSAESAVAVARDVYAAAKSQWSYSKELTGTVPYRLPRQVYAHHNAGVGGGGLSDPTWAGGGGRAGGGDIGTSRELTMAHEMDHNLDRAELILSFGAHIGGCDVDDSDQFFPWPDLRITDRGYDVPNLLPVSAREYDLMSYCRNDTVGPAKWLGAYRWVNLLDEFRTDGGGTPGIPDVPVSSAAAAAGDPAEPDTAPDVLQISGAVDRRSGAVTLDPVFRGPGVPQDPAADGAYAVEVLNAAGARVASHHFDVRFRDVEGGLKRRALFGVDLAAPAELREIRVVRVATGRVLARRVLSASAPQVRIVAPNGGETLPARPFDLVVDARDPDGDPLTWRVMASGDGGVTWLPAPGQPSRGRLRIDPATLPGGSESLLRVEATDGLRTSADQSDSPFLLPVTPPQPSIRQPLDGAHLRTGQVAVLRGNAVSSSLQELPAENLLWFDGDRLIGEGEEARVLLPPGAHDLRLVAVDAVGEVTGAQRVRIDVGACGEDGRRRGRGHEQHGNGRGEGHERHGDGVPCGTVVPGTGEDDNDDDEGRDP